MKMRRRGGGQIGMRECLLLGTIGKDTDTLDSFATKGRGGIFLEKLRVMNGYCSLLCLIQWRTEDKGTPKLGGKIAQ